MSDSLKWCAERDEERERAEERQREEEERLARRRERAENEHRAYLRKQEKEEQAKQEAAEKVEVHGSEPSRTSASHDDFIARYKMRILSEILYKSCREMDFPSPAEIVNAVHTRIKQDLRERGMPAHLSQVSWSISARYGIHDELIYECTPTPLCGKTTRCAQVNRCFLFTTEFPGDPARRPVATADYDFMHGWLTHALKVSES